MAEFTYEGEHCVVDHQNGPGQDYWYITDVRGGGYDCPEWPTREAMLAELRAIVAALEATDG